VTDERGPALIMKGAKLNKRGNVRVTLTLRHICVRIFAVESIKYYIAH